MTLATWFSISTTRPAARLASKRAAILLLGALLFSLSTALPAARAGKPSPPPPSIILPPARYQLIWLGGEYGSGHPRDINNSGTIVGNYSSGADPSTWTAFYSTLAVTRNLNELSPVWLDLNLSETAPPAAGWWAVDAYGINEAGDIVGTAENMDQTLPSRGFILVDAFGPNPCFLLLPTIGAVDHVARDINNSREVVGWAVGLGLVRYRPIGAAWPYYGSVLEISATSFSGVGINDDGVVVAALLGSPGTSYRQLVSGMPPVEFPGHQFWSISNGITPLMIPAMIGGSRVSAKGKNGQAGGAIQLPVLGAANDARLVYSGSDFQYSRAINDHGDLCFEASSRGFMYFDPDSNPLTPNPYGTNGNGILPLDSLVVNPDPDWSDSRYLIRLDGINNRGPTGFGQICGWAPGTRGGFLLIPVPAP